jgi:4'-phosphopantetheinyl transferase
LTPVEINALFQTVSQYESLRQFFWIWTLKEAYSKALGLGLGFDFRRIEYNVLQNTVKVDGVAPKGWQFSKFEFGDMSDAYQGIVAEFVDGDDTTFLSRPQVEWVVQYKAEEFMQLALEALLTR